MSASTLNEFVTYLQTEVTIMLIPDIIPFHHLQTRHHIPLLRMVKAKILRSLARDDLIIDFFIIIAPFNYFLSAIFSSIGAAAIDLGIGIAIIAIIGGGAICI